ncbi:cysteine proteinase [Serendipita vermifera]|nr:cysteine proteinase [Serendipita vermifera]
MSTQIREAYEGTTTTQDNYQRRYSNGKNGTGSNHGVTREGDSVVSMTLSPAALSPEPSPVSSHRASLKQGTTEAITPKVSRQSNEPQSGKSEKPNRSSSSVVPAALKNVGRKLKPSNSIAGLQFNPGLINLGNSCYLNSTVQGLFSTKLLENMVEFSVPPEYASYLHPELSPALRNGRGENPLPPVNGMELCMAFIRTMERGWQLRDTYNARQRVSMSAKELRNRVGLKYEQYLDFQQQDAHEYLRHLLDCMYMEEFDVIKKRQPPPVKRKRGKSGKPVSDPPQPVLPHERLTPFVDQVFGGQLASMLVCSSCKHVSQTYEPFMDLSLSIRSEEDKESKRNRLKAFAQRFTRQSGKSVPRPLSNPPSPRKVYVDLEPPLTTNQRHSFEEVRNGSDSDPEEAKPQPSPKSLAPPPSDTANGIGRKISGQFGLRKSGERSRSRERATETKDEQKQKDKEKAAYLRKIMADTGPSKNPIELLKTGMGVNGSTNGDSITAAAASWLRLGPTTGPSLVHCLRQFTAVESLDGENMVGCSRCWKQANPTYVSRRKRSSSTSSSSSSSSSESSSDEDESESMTRTNGISKPVNAPIPSSTGSQALAQMSTYRGPPIPSISTTSPPDIHSALALTRQRASETSTTTATSNASSTYLTPSSTKSHSKAESADDESVSTSSISDVSAPSPKVRRREVRLKAPSIPKSQRVMLRRAYKRYLIAAPPPVLVIHLKRFQQVSRTPIALFGSLKKIDDFIAFPEYLDLKPFIAPRREEFGLRPAKIKDDKGAYDEQVMYRLYAVVVHIGNMLGGHYIAYTALPSPEESSSGDQTSKTGESPRRWSFQSDEIVRVASLEEVLAAKAYLCFYERINGPLPSSVEGVSTSGPSVQPRKK